MQHAITNMKCREEGGVLRLTFAWPNGIAQVYVNEKLYTLAEYRQRGGYIAPAKAGLNTFIVCPFTREGGWDTLYPRPDGQNELTYIVRTGIRVQIDTRDGLWLNHRCSFTATHAVPPGVLAYNGHDFAEEIPVVGLVRVVRLDVPLQFSVKPQHEGFYILECEGVK
jgi:hypothetical protein